MNTALLYDTAKTGTAETVSALLDHFSIQAEGRNKAMDNAIRVEKAKAIILEIHCKVDEVIDKLETLANLFEFYWYAREKTDFNKDSINGLTLIISDCIDDLKEAVKREPESL